MRGIGILSIAVLMTGCRTHPSSVGKYDCPNPYSLAAETLPPRIPTEVNGIPDGTVVVGTVVDSVSGRGVISALVRLIGIAPNGKDSALGRADSSGAFTIVGVRPGRYRLSAGAANYRLDQDSIAVRPGLDTVQIVLKRGAPICRVTLD